MVSLPSEYDISLLHTAANKVIAAVTALRRLKETCHGISEDQRQIVIKQKLDNAESAAHFIEIALGALRKYRTSIAPDGELPERPPPGVHE